MKSGMVYFQNTSKGMQNGPRGYRFFMHVYNRNLYGCIWSMYLVLPDDGFVEDDIYIYIYM